NMKYRHNFVRRSSRTTAFGALSRYAGAISNAPVAGLNTKQPQASVRSGAGQLTLIISGAIDVSATSPCVSEGLNPARRENTSIPQEGPSSHPGPRRKDLSIRSRMGRTGRRLYGRGRNGE